MTRARAPHGRDLGLVRGRFHGCANAHFRTALFIGDTLSLMARHPDPPLVASSQLGNTMIRIIFPFYEFWRNLLYRAGKCLFAILQMVRIVLEDPLHLLVPGPGPATRRRQKIRRLFISCELGGCFLGLENVVPQKASDPEAGSVSVVTLASVGGQWSSLPTLAYGG